LDTTRCRTNAYRPETNGAIERSHQVMKATLRCFAQKYGNDWDLAMPAVIFAMRTAVNDRGLSPSLMVYGEQMTMPGLFVSPEISLDETSDQTFVNELFRHWRRIRDFVFETDPRVDGNDEIPNTGPYPHKSVWVKKEKNEGSLRFKVKGPYEVVNFKYPVVTVRIGDREKKYNMNQCKGAYKAPPGFLDDDGIRPDTFIDAQQPQATTHLQPEQHTRVGLEVEDDEVEFNMDVTDEEEEADKAEELEVRLAIETKPNSKPLKSDSKASDSNIDEMLKLCKPLSIPIDKV